MQDLTPSSLAETIIFVVLIADIFWFAWFVNVRIDVLFRNAEQESRFIESWKRNNKQFWLLRGIGLVMYSPYISPVKSITIWGVITFMLIFIMVSI
jgi:hypothetical protein